MRSGSHSASYWLSKMKNWMADLPKAWDLTLHLIQINQMTLNGQDCADWSKKYTLIMKKVLLHYYPTNIADWLGEATDFRRASCSRSQQTSKAHITQSDSFAQPTLPIHIGTTRSRTSPQSVFVVSEWICDMIGQAGVKDEHVRVKESNQSTPSANEINQSQWLQNRRRCVKLFWLFSMTSHY